MSGYKELKIDHIEFIPGDGYKWHNFPVLTYKELEQVVTTAASGILNEDSANLMLVHPGKDWKVVTRITKQAIVIPVEQVYVENGTLFPQEI